MNTNNLKKYAPQARRDFMEAVAKRLNQLGIAADSKGKLTISTPVVSGSMMQIEGLSFDAGLARARDKLAQRAERMGFEQVVEQMAYTWFNRLSAIRFMELHGYLDHNLRVLSPSPSKGEGRGEGFQPEILDHAQDVAADLGLDRNHIVELKLAGNKDEELYRILLLGQCHQLQLAMPFLFEALDDETELLLPDNLTRTDSILRGLVDSIPEDDWQQVEIIGWLYQFYISEKKDQVIGSVVKSEDIPAATQLFTPNWIVKYLVQNSVGRQWLMTYPDSGLKAQMEYYIEPTEQELSVVVALAAITPTSIDPETLKVLDPACGSGHILVEAYDILKAIYEERGYRVRDIPKLILEKNLYGLDIDDRAAQLAGFALMMKAREDDRRIFTRDIQLNVLAIQSTQHLFATPQARHSGIPSRAQVDCRNPSHMDVEASNHPWPLDPGTRQSASANPCRGDALADLWRRLDIHSQAKRGSMESIFDEPQPVDMREVRHSGRDCRNPDCMESSELAIPGTGYPLPGGYDGSTNTMDDIEFKQLRAILVLFEQAKNLGSLIQVPHEQAEYLRSLTSRLRELTEQGDSMQKQAATALLPYVQQAWLLAQQYDAVVANPPYMGGKGMNAALKEIAKKQFPDSKSDLFAMFIERGFEWCKPNGFNSMVTMQSWMFLSSYESLREKLLCNRTISTMAHLGARAFPEISGEVVQTTATVFHQDRINDYKPVFFRLVDGNDEQKETILRLNKNRFDKTVQDDFNKIPGCPIAYWANKKIIDSFSGKKIFDVSISDGQNITADNDKFVRLWWEVNYSSFGRNKKWLTYCKGGEYKKWYGNLEHVIDWSPNTRAHYRSSERCRIIPEYLWYRIGITWSRVSSKGTPNAFRLLPSDTTFDKVGSSIFIENDDDLKLSLGILNSKLSEIFIPMLNPTIDLQVRDVRNIPYKSESLNLDKITNNVNIALNISNQDWDSFETSWKFQSNKLTSIVPTLQRGNAESDAGALPDAFPRQSVGTIKAAFEQWQTQNKAAITEMQRLEEENNRLFIEAYGLQDELTPEVPEDQITLIRADQEKDIQRLISYAIGCMMGRYRLDRPGLIYAHAGNVDFERIYNADIPPNSGTIKSNRHPGRDCRDPEATNGVADSHPCELGSGNPCRNDDQMVNSIPLTFPADEDGILPLTDQEWFKDDATNRFREFLLAVWGEDTLQQNLEFVAESLTLSSFKPKKGETSLDTVRRYLSNQFYKDHLQTYKKRPIYWLFSSGKQKAFECLVYLHRYNDSTLARMRTEYVSPLLGKYSAYADQLNQQLQDASSSEATRIKKDIHALEKKQTELRQFDDKLKHYADMRIKLDLDEGVKVNYGKFGELLAEVKAVTGGSE